MQKVQSNTAPLPAETQANKMMSNAAAGRDSDPLLKSSSMLPVKSRFSMLPDNEVTMAITKKDFSMSHSPAPVELPESIYGAAMMAIIRFSQSYHGVVHVMTACLLAALVLNIVIQFYVLVCSKCYITAPAVASVRHLYDSFHREAFVDGELSQEKWEQFELADELCQLPLSQPWFFLAILSIWIGTCWIDLLESFRYLSLWVALPCTTDGQATEVVEDGDDVVMLKACRSIKAGAIAVISIPKITIVVLVWWLGARWLVATTAFQDLLLNAVALAFITELDELIYMCLVPEEVKAMV